MTQVLAGRLNVATRSFELREVPVPGDEVTLGHEVAGTIEALDQGVDYEGGEPHPAHPQALTTAGRGPPVHRP